MSSSVAAQIMRQADAVKNTMTESGKAFSELWVVRQKLEDLYKKMLLLDLEYALDKKVEQELWNNAFKNQINTLQSQAKDRQNPKKVEAQASLNLFLETASGFYLQFLQMICSTFKLDLPFRRKSAAFGIMRENAMNYKTIVTPKKSSCLYICCHCLVHLGDLARYRQQMEQAQTYYRHAANLSPNNGQPYNQLAILEASRGDKLSTVFYYVRSLAVRHPFPVAATNLEKFYSKLIKDTRSDFDGTNLTMSEVITAFMHFQALLHMSTGLDRASNLKTKIVAGLANHIRGQSVSAAHLTGIVAISVFALHRARFDTIESGESVKKTVLSVEEEKIVQIHLSFIVKLLETLMQYTPKEDGKARDFPTLSAIKVLFDWLYLNKDILQGKEFSNSSIWSDLCKLLNTLQWLLNENNRASDLSKFEDTPLPEDTDLRCFQPLEPSYSTYNFNKALNEDLSLACERDLRCQRLLAHGKWIAQDLPKLKLVIYQPTKSIRTQFSTQKAVTQTNESQTPPSQKSSQRQNVAMQTIMKKQMQKKMEQIKNSTSTSPLSVISEEGKFTPSESTAKSLASELGQDVLQSANQKPGLGGRQAGVINIHHKGNNQKNLPPRLSAKVSGVHSSNLSPRLQKKIAPNSSRNGNSSVQIQSHKNESIEGAKEGGKEIPAFTDHEAYPSLNMDNYPALPSQRNPASLVVTEGSSSHKNFLASPQWGVLNLGRDSATSGNPLLSMGNNASSPSLDSTSESTHSPQPSPRIISPFSGPDQTMRTMEQSMLDQGMSGLSADFLSSMRPPSSLVQQQQHSYHALQQLQQGLDPHVQFQRPSYMNNLLNQHQPNQAMRNPLGVYPNQPSMNPNSLFKQNPVPASNAQSLNIGQSPSSYPSSINHGLKLHGQSSLGNLNVPPPQRGPPSLMLDSRQATASPVRGYQASRVDTSSEPYMTNSSAPVGYIPPTAVAPKGQPSGLGNPSFNSSMMPGVPVGAGRSTNNGQQNPYMVSNSTHMGSSAHMGNSTHLNSQNFLQQQMPSMKPQQSGMLYKNIPLPGTAINGSSNPNNLASLFMPGQNLIQGQSHTSSQQQGYNRGGQPNNNNNLLQDSRLSSSFLGHAAGTPKPDKQNSSPQFNPQQHPMKQQGSGNQQSMIRAVMDPPFLQASGEYTLFSNNSMPGWPTSLVKQTPNQIMKAPVKGSVSGGLMSTNPMMSGGGHGDPGNNLQGLWTSTGPSPLERLLEQQRGQRQTDG